MLLKDKVAVVYGAGAVGGAVAKAFAHEGAAVYLAGHTLEKEESLAQDIRSQGGTVEAGFVDALDKKSVDEHLAGVVKKAGKLDVSFNAIGLGDAQGVPLLEMTQDHFMMPITAAMQTQFLTGTAAARHMSKNKSGMILAIAAQAGARPYPNAGGFGVACSAIESICRLMAAEFGPLGIRVICLRSSGSPDAPGVFLAWKAVAESQGKPYEEFAATMAEKTLLKRGPMLADVANAAAMLVSDHANGMTAAIANITCGEVVD